jgi:hypothetical protein
MPAWGGLFKSPLRHEQVFDRASESTERADGAAGRAEVPYWAGGAWRLGGMIEGVCRVGGLVLPLQSSLGQRHGGIILVARLRVILDTLAGCVNTSDPVSVP